jgi:hypothetical protein
MRNTSVSKRDIDFTYYRQRARLLRNEAMNDLFMAAATAFVNVMRRVRRIAMRAIKGIRVAVTPADN